MAELYQAGMMMTHVLEVLCELMGVSSLEHLDGQMLPDWGVFLGLTLDPIEGVLIWYYDIENSTRVTPLEEICRDRELERNSEERAG